MPHGDKIVIASPYLSDISSLQRASTDWILFEVIYLLVVIFLISIEALYLLGVSRHAFSIANDRGRKSRLDFNSIGHIATANRKTN